MLILLTKYLNATCPVYILIVLNIYFVQFYYFLVNLLEKNVKNIQISNCVYNVNIFIHLN